MLLFLDKLLLSIHAAFYTLVERKMNFDAEEIKNLTGGCTYCNNRTFNPDYCRAEKSITEQINERIRFFSRKYPEMKYLAYFQAYTNTYREMNELQRKYEEAHRFAKYMVDLLKSMTLLDVSRLLNINWNISKKVIIQLL